MVNPRAGGSQGSSTGAPGIPVATQDTRSHYDPTTTGYNPATGAAYSKALAGQSHQETSYQPTTTATPVGYDRPDGQDDRIGYASSTVQRPEMEEAAATSKMDTASESRAVRAAEDVGRKVKEAGATVHVSLVICEAWGWIFSIRPCSGQLSLLERKMLTVYTWV